AFALEPRLAASASIARWGELRHDSLKPMLGTSAKECSTIAGKFIAELNWAGAVSAKKPLQLGAAINQWLVAQILAIQVENVEGVKSQRVRKPSESATQRLEIRYASLI